MKKILIGLITAVFAVTSGVFANDGEHLKFSLAAVTYYNVGGGVYTLTTPLGGCTMPDPNMCSYIFPNNANNTPPSGFVSPSLPTNLVTGVTLGGNRRYD